MTSSEPPTPEPPIGPPQDAPGDPAPAPTTEAAPPTPVIIAGHLHPGMLFLKLLEGLRQALVPTVLGLVAQQLWLIGVAAIVFMMAMAYALARYLTFRYRLTAEELITTEGILHRQERRIPINRIQDLSFESTLVRRIFGLVVVSVETASSQGAEARLDSLARRDAEQLRQSLYRARSAHAGEDPAAPVEQAPEYLLYRVSGGELTLLGLTDNRFGVILAAMFGLYELTAEFGLDSQLGGLFGQLATALGSLHWTLLSAVIMAIAFLALLGGWAVSIAASFLMFHDFRLTLREDIFQRRYGLVTTRAASLPRRKIQRVLLEQSFLRRLSRLVVLRADSAGSGMDPREEARGGRDVVVPLAEERRVTPLLPVLLPELDPTQIQWQPVSPKVIRRVFIKGALIAALALAIGLPTVGLVALAALLILPLSYGIGLLLYRNLAYTEPDGHLGLRWGLLGRYRAIIPLRKVQALVVRQTPLDRPLGLARLTAYVAGGSPTTLAHLPYEEAVRMQQSLVRIVARSRFVW